MLSAAGHVRLAPSRSPGMTTARRAHRVLLVGALAVRRRRRLGHVQQPEHRGDDGHGADLPARDRGRRAHDAAEHRRGHLDRVRAGDRHLLGRRRTRCSRSSPASRPGSRTRRSNRSCPTCTRRCGCWRRPRSSAARSACCGRRGTESCASANWRARRGRPRGPFATTRRSGCCRRPTSASPARIASTAADDVARVRELLRLKQMLGLSLDELRDRDARRGRARASAGASTTRRPTPPSGGGC